MYKERTLDSCTTLMQYLHLFPLLINGEFSFLQLILNMKMNVKLSVFRFRNIIAGLNSASASGADLDNLFEYLKQRMR